MNTNTTRPGPVCPECGFPTGPGAPARLLAALIDPGSAGTADPDPVRRAELAEACRGEAIAAHARLLAEVHDIDADPAWLYAGQPTETVIAQALDLAGRVRDAAAVAVATITAASARRTWLATGRLLRCAGGGDTIDPTAQAWQVCRGLAEHTECHEEDPATEDRQRTNTIAVAEDAAHSEDRLRCGRPYPGDLPDHPCGETTSTPATAPGPGPDGDTR